MDIKGDWTDYIAQALEHKNKECKSQARITSKRRMLKGDVQKYKKNGEKVKDMYDELAVQDLVGGHVIWHRASRPSLSVPTQAHDEGVLVAQGGYQSRIR
jgi:hypothetical protein